MEKKTYPRKDTESCELLEYLKTHQNVTVKDICDDLGIYCHTSLMHNLRHRHGIRIDCVMVKGVDGKRYGVYTLVE